MSRSRLLICLASACVWIGVLGLAPPAQAAPDVQCTGPIGAVVIMDNVNVPPGAGCQLLGTTITGNVFVNEGSRLLTQDANIAGNIQGEGANRVRIFNTVVTNIQLKKVKYHIVISSDSSCKADPLVLGRIQLDENPAIIAICKMSTREDVQLTKNTGPIGIWDNNIGEDLQLFDNTGMIRLGRNMVGENMQVIKNLGGVEINLNVVTRLLQCFDNNPPPTGVGNIAAMKEGQCVGL